MFNIISKIVEFGKNNDLEKIEELLETTLIENPNNIELLLRLAVLQLAVPLVDDYKSIEYLERILTIEKNNVIAFLLLSYIYNYDLSGISEQLKNKLDSLSSESNEINSMLKYMISLFYREKGILDLEEHYLKLSIDIYKKHVWNYVHLAKIYFERNRDSDARKLILTALKNVKKVYSDENRNNDITDVGEFLNERIKGIYLSSSNFDRIQKLK